MLSLIQRVTSASVTVDDVVVGATSASRPGPVALVAVEPGDGESQFRRMTERLLGYLNRGDTTFCVNLPNVQLAEVSRAHRLLHIHRNQPGVLAELNRALSAAGLNILGQHLKTDERTGYVITDVDRDYDPEVLKTLRDLPGTLRFRTLH